MPTTGLCFRQCRKLWKYRKCSTLTGWSMFPLLQFIDGCERPCDHAVTELKGFFSAFCAFFALLRVVPELSASRRWGALDDEEFFVIEGSGGGADAGSFSQVSGHQVVCMQINLSAGSFMFGQTHMLTSFPEQQQQHNNNHNNKHKAQTGLVNTLWLLFH